MGVSISGLVSNMDTDSIVAALVSGYTVKKDSYVKAQKKLEWKQEAWKDLNTKVLGFYQKYLNDMRFSTAFNKKSASVSSSKATATASSNAVNGTQKLKINQLATSGYLTGGVVSKADASDTSDVTGSTKLSELGIENGSKITIDVGGKEKSITVNANTTVNSFVNSLKDAGVNASFDEKNQRFFVSSKVSGEKGDFNLSADNEGGANALRAMGLSLTTANDMDRYSAFAALTDSDLQKMIDTDYTKQKTALYDINDETTVKKLKDSLQNEIKTLSKQKDDATAANKTIDYKLAAVNSYDSEYNILTADEQATYMSNLDNQIKELGAKTDRTEEENTKLEELKAKRTVYSDLSKEGTDQDAYRTDLEDTKAENEELITNLTLSIETDEGILADDSKFENYVSTLNDNITDANNALKDRLTDYYTDKRDMAQKYVDAYALVNTEGVDKSTEEYKNAVALLGDSGSKTSPTRIVGQDAEIELNGAVFNSNTNSFQINGLTINANSVTDPGEEITITTDTDNQGIYDMIKNFFKEYNSLINEMDKLYNADSAKGYEPLTDDEKEAMSDKEVEKWEQKIKDSLFRRDSTLESFSSAVKTAFQSVVEIGGKKYSLSSFGIKTLSYFSSADNEKSAFHIDGDKDDTNTSGNSDKLMAAIASDPDTVATFFNKLAQNVYDVINKKMRTSTLSSFNTIYNDKVMKREHDEYSDYIKKWEDKIETYENRYRKQFSEMEKALSTLNSQQTQLTGLFG